MGNQLRTPFRIEICGGIASGKTTFANLFADVADVVLEDFTAVPFWRAFYDSPGLYNLESELSFLLQHYHQVKRFALQTPRSRLLVCDFSLSLDRAYCAVSLDDRKRRVFEAVCDEVLNDIGPPEILVHLKCPPEILVSRMRDRGREEETLISTQFLTSLDSAIDDEINQSSKSGSRIAIDSHLRDFATDVETKEQCRKSLLSRVSEIMSNVAAPQ